MEPTLSVVVVLYNSAGVVGDCLRSIRADVASGWAEVILVDNASPDASVEAGLAVLPQARWLRLDRNRGFAGGANAGIRATTGRYILLLNPDVRVGADTLRRLVAWMESNPGLSAASPRVVSSDGTDASVGRALPSMGRSLLELTRLHKMLPGRLRGRLLQGAYWTGGDQLNVGWVPGTAMIVRRSAATTAGLLLEEFFMYGEDIEWCHRIGRAGGRLGVYAGACVVHDWGASSRLSWGEAEAERRVIGGIAAACAVMYGEAHARAIVAVNALAALIEACVPGRSREQRAVAWTRTLNWSRYLTVRRPSRRLHGRASAPERIR